MEQKWYAWVMRRNKLNEVLNFIKTEVPEVDKYFYPKIRKERRRKNSDPAITEAPLYEGYIFLRYSNPDYVYHKLRSFPLLTTFTGEIKESEVLTMESFQGKLLSELKVKRFEKGEVVKILEGPFKEFEGLVVSVNKDRVLVRVNSKLLGKNDISLSFLESQVEKKGLVSNITVQDI